MQNSKKGKAVVGSVKNFKVGIVAARFNSDVTGKLHASAVWQLKKLGVPQKGIVSISVAGAVEVPVALQALAETGKYDCLVAIACIIRGDTPHFDYVANMVQQGVLRVMLDYHIPIGFGVLTLENKAQAKTRYHVGAEAAIAALELAEIKKSVK